MATITFDSLEFVEQLTASGVPEDQAKGHAKAIGRVLEQVEESRLKELSTKGDIELAKAELRKEIETAKVETIKWVVATGIIILGGVAAINRLFPPVATVHDPQFAQEMKLPVTEKPNAPVVSPSP
ncbi:MAG: DUF1640 domain-containing protein [Magnetococcales bacterium]|nr:DUF1640 domain-containing protein [Magnetococcales bacterium]